MRTLVISAILLAAGCSGKAATSNSGSALGPSITGVGQSCVPVQETSTSFAGFSEQEVTLDDQNAACSAGAVCLVNHFRGRVTCPYGQVNGGSTCTASGAPVRAAVSPQCTDRRAADTVYCSCRCANAEGRTDDGASYCACPSDHECAQLIVPIGPSSSEAGGYCIKRGTAYSRESACSASCDPATQNCR